MAARHKAIDREIGVQPGQDLRGARHVAPITHQIAYDGEEADELDAGAHHAQVGGGGDERACGAAGFDVGPNGVAGGAEGEGAEGRADVGDDAGDDNLRFIRGAYGGLEVGVVPGVNWFERGEMVNV